MDETKSPNPIPLSKESDIDSVKIKEPLMEDLLLKFISDCEQSNFASLIYDIEKNRLIIVNKLMKEKFGITSDELYNDQLYELGKKFQIRGTISKQNFKENMIKAFKGNKEEFTEIFTNKHGEIFLAKISMEKIPSPYSKYIIINLVDISSESDINTALSQLADPERIFLSNTLEGIMIIDPTISNTPNGIKHLNTRLADMLGYKLDEFNHLGLFGPPLSPRIQPNGTPSVEFGVAQITKALNGENPTFEWLYMHKLGNKVYVEIHLQKLVYNNKQLIRASYIDITKKRGRERKKSSDLFESERRYEFLLKYAPEAILLYEVPSQAMSEFDEKNKVTFVNENFAKMLKYSEEEIKEKILYAPPFSPEIQPNGKKSKDWVIELNERVFEGENPIYEWLHYDSTGEEVYCEFRLTLLPFQEKTFVRATVVDITDKKRKEKELEQLHKEFNHSMKMEAIGRMAGGITHNFNNIISTIIGYTDFLISNSDGGNEIMILTEIKKAAERATSLSRELLDFSKKRELKTENVSINSVINSIESIIHHSIPRTINIEYYLTSNLADIQIDPFQFEQVLTNMVINAKDAILLNKSTGKIVISTTYMDIETMKGKFRLLEPKCDCSYVVLSIQDDGSGIDETIQDKIFEPFFTTKGEENGTGLGLSSVYAFMNNINGYLDFESEINEGTIFNLYFSSLPNANCNSVFHS